MQTILIQKIKKNDDNNVNSENKQNENIQAENNNNQTGENSTQIIQI